MRRMKLIAVAALSVSLVASAAQAHKDPNSDPSSGTNARCDTWYRDGYDVNHNGTTRDDWGSQGDAQHRELGDPNHTAITAESGHYVVDGDAGYVEVVGGNDYRRPMGDPSGPRGGWVSGEIDPVAGGPDVDFLAGTFFGTAPPETPGAHEVDLCVNVLNTRVEHMDCHKPPKLPPAGPNCN